MAFQVSPGVQVSEIDLTNVVPAVSSTTGAFAGQFKWGPVDEVKTVSDSKGLIDEFFSPANTDAGAEDFYSAEAFLKYGSSLRVVRISNLCYSANAAGHGTSILKNDAEYESTFKGGTQSGTVGNWVSRYAGSLGNSLKVSVCASSNAYYNDSVTTVGGAEAIGQTTISVAASNVFNVRDQIKFQGDTTFYRVVSKPDATSITIEALNQPAGTGLVVAQSNGNNIDRYWEFHNLFDKAPGISAGQAAVSGAADEVHVVVVDEDGAISGSPQSVLETHGFLSLASDSKDASGRSNYYKNVIARDSQWIWWSGHDSNVIASSTVDRTHLESVSSAFLRPALPIDASLAGGSDGRSPTAGQKYGAWDTHFADGDTVDISFLICGSTRTDNGSGVDQDTLADHNTIVNQGILLAESRKDCMFICSPRKSSIVDVSSESTQVANVKADFASVTSSSYAVLDSGWVYQYDRFNDKYCWVPGNGHTAGIMARSDLLRDPWFSPAGFSRGQYLGITKLAFNPKQASRDDLYRARINPIVTFPGQGTVLFGDKTALTTPSAFDRINVRRLFIVLEKAIAAAAQAQLFEFNDAFTRAQFRSAVEPFLRDVKNRRGLVDFSVICDETNNTDTVIDRNEFVCSIFVKPARSINFIQLNFVAARSGVEFSEIYSAV
jgi:phage tail sheath protein FI